LFFLVIVGLIWSLISDGRFHPLGLGVVIGPSVSQFPHPHIGRGIQCPALLTPLQPYFVALAPVEIQPFRSGEPVLRLVQVGDPLFFFGPTSPDSILPVDSLFFRVTGFPPRLPIVPGLRKGCVRFLPHFPPATFFDRSTRSDVDWPRIVTPPIRRWGTHARVWHGCLRATPPFTLSNLVGDPVGCLKGAVFAMLFTLFFIFIPGPLCSHHPRTAVSRVTLHQRFFDTTNLVFFFNLRPFVSFCTFLILEIFLGSSGFQKGPSYHVELF